MQLNITLCGSIQNSYSAGENRFCDGSRGQARLTNQTIAAFCMLANHVLPEKLEHRLAFEPRARTTLEITGKTLPSMPVSTNSMTTPLCQTETNANGDLSLQPLQ
jgi:hypothetical protein